MLENLSGRDDWYVVYSMANPEGNPVELRRGRSKHP